MYKLKSFLKKNLLKSTLGTRLWQFIRAVSLLKEKSFRDLFLEINQKDICLDLGANIGFASLVMWLRGVQIVYALEPNQEAFNELRKNIKGIKKISIFNKAISSSTKKEKLFLHRSIKEKVDSRKILAFSQSSSLMANKTNVGDCYYEVNSINFKDLYEMLPFKPSVIKCDIEGGEYIIFEQLIDLARSKSIRKIFVECHSKKYPQFKKEHESFIGLIRQNKLEEIIDTSWH